MKKKVYWLSSIGFVLSTVALAWATQAAEPVADAATASKMGSLPYFVWTTVAIGIGFAFTAGICGLAQGLAVGRGLEGIARQPEASDRIQITMILGLAFIESLALFALFIDIVLLFANPFIKYLQ